MTFKPSISLIDFFSECWLVVPSQRPVTRLQLSFSPLVQTSIYAIDRKINDV